MTAPRALLILHNSSQASALAGELSDEGYEVDVVDSWLTAIRHIWQDRYDRVVVEADLPGVRAHDVASHIGALAPDAEILLVEPLHAA